MNILSLNSLDTRTSPKLVAGQETRSLSTVTVEHYQELLNSAIAPDIIEGNFISLEGENAVDTVLPHVEWKRRNDRRLIDSDLRKFQALADGGWWCNGIDSITLEDSVWGCFKPDRPRLSKDGKPIKYEHPHGVPTEAFCLRVTRHYWRQIAKKAGLDCPDLESIPNEAIAQSFLQWVINTPDVPIIITEGAKKTASLLSHGYAAIGLPGIFNGYRTPKDEYDNRLKDQRHLIPQVEAFCQEGREIVFCFDNDTKPATIKNVQAAIAQTARLIKQQGCNVSVMTWNGLAKGIDDVIVANGETALDHIYATRQTPEQFAANYRNALNRIAWDIFRSLANASETINQPFMNGIKCFQEGQGTGIKAGMGTGKTVATVEQAQQLDGGLLTPGYRNSLGSQFCHKVNSHEGPARMVMMKDYTGQDLVDNIMLHLCVDSLLKLVQLIESEKIDFAEYVSTKFVFIDEVMSVIDHLLSSTTLNGKRVECLDIFIMLLKNCKGFAYADANLADWAVNLLEYWSGKPQVVTHNTHSNIKAKLHFLEGSIKDEDLKKHDNYGFLLEMIAKINNGQAIAVCSDSQIFIESCQEYLQTYCQGVKILRIDGKTSSTKLVREFLKDPDKWLEDHPGWVVLYTTSAESGLDISIKGYFAGHWGFYFGIISCNSFAQLMGRIRDQSVDKHVWVRTFSIAQNDDEVSFSAEALKHYERQALMLESNLLFDDYAEKASQIQTLHRDSYQFETAIALQAKAMRNYERANLRECMLAVLGDCGYQITHETIARTGDVQAAKKGFGKAKDAVKDQNVSDIANASNKFIGQPTARLSMDSDYGDQCAIKKAMLCDRLPGFFDPNEMDQEALRLIIYEQPRLIAGKEKLFLANDTTGLAKLFGRNKLERALEKNVVIPWKKDNFYLESRLLAAIGIQRLIDALQSQGSLNNDDPIVQEIYAKAKGVISIDGQKGRGTYFLKRSIPKSPIKLASLLLSKVAFPHFCHMGTIEVNGKALAKIKPYESAIDAAIKKRFEAMTNKIFSRPVPEEPVTDFTVTTVTAQSYTEIEIEAEKIDNILYKDPIPEKTDNVLNFNADYLSSDKPSNLSEDDPFQTFHVGQKVGLWHDVFQRFVPSEIIGIMPGWTGFLKIKHLEGWGGDHLFGRDKLFQGRLAIAAPIQSKSSAIH